jgi:hypothetical protein
LKQWDITYPRVPAYNREQQQKWKADALITGLYGRKKQLPPVFDRETEGYYNRIAVNYRCKVPSIGAVISVSGLSRR